MASGNRTGPNVTLEPTTSGKERSAATPAGAGDGWWRERITGVVNARKERVSDRLGAVAETVRKVGAPLRDEPFSKLGAYTDEAARAIERVATGLRDRDVDELAEDVRGFARSRPAAFVGTGLAVGLVAGRFLRSSGGSARSSGPTPRGGSRVRTTAAGQTRARGPATGGTR